MSRVNKFLLAHASGKNVLLFLSLAVISFVLMAFIITPAFQDETDGLRPLDLNFGVNAEIVYRDLPSYSDRSKTLYIAFAVIDYIYPATAATFFALFWAWMIGRAPHDRYDRILALGLLVFPFLFALIDWLENVGFLFVVFSYPTEFPGIADLAGSLKKLKPFVELLIVIITIVIAIATIRLSRRKRATR